MRASGKETARPSPRGDTSPRQLLRGFEGLSVIVLHPEDADGSTLLRELRRIGCVARGIWPPPMLLPAEAGALFCLLSDSVRELLLAQGAQMPFPVVGLLEERDQAALLRLRECVPQAVLHKPIVPEQMVSALYLARLTFQYQTRLLRRIAKLDDTLKSIRNVERAKAILMESRNLDEHQAYHFMRRQAMQKRVPIGVIASTIIDASHILG